MTFQFSPLPSADFAPLFALGDAELAADGIRRVTAQPGGRYPCRVSLAYAPVGAELLLLHHEHIPDRASPYHGGYAIYVQVGAAEARPAPGEVPALFEGRQVAVRGFGKDWMLKAAQVVEGRAAIAEALEAVLAGPEVAEAHVHFAAHGCFAAKVRRV